MNEVVTEGNILRQHGGLPHWGAFLLYLGLATQNIYGSVRWFQHETRSRRKAKPAKCVLLPQHGVRRTGQKTLREKDVSAGINPKGPLGTFAEAAATGTKEIQCNTSRLSPVRVVTENTRDWGSWRRRAL